MNSRSEFAGKPRLTVSVFGTEVKMATAANAVASQGGLEPRSVHIAVVS